MKTARGILVSTLALCVGCAGTTFSLSYSDTQRNDLGQKLAAIKARNFSPVNERARVFMVTRRPNPSLVAFDLGEQRVSWKVAAELASRVVVGKGLLYYSTPKGDVEARRVSDGQKQWSWPMPVGTRLLGMSASSGRLYLASEVVARKGGGPAAYLSAVGEGRLLWQRPSQGRLGAPVARDGLVIVPLRYQWIAIVSGDTGEEVARVRSKEESLLWVRKTPRGVFFGGKNGVYQLDAAAASGTRAASSFVAAALPDTVHPSYWRDGYNASLAGYTALDRNRLLWFADQKRFYRDAVYVHNYRYFFAFEGTPARSGREDVERGETKVTGTKKVGTLTSGKPAATGSNDRMRASAPGGLERGAGAMNDLDAAGKGVEPEAAKLKWAFSFPRVDVVASYHTGESLLLVSASGDVVSLDLATGAVLQKRASGLHVQGASFDALGFRPAGAGAAKPDLRAALTEMIWDPDRRFQDVKLFGVQQLARLSGTDVARALLQIVTRPGVSPAVYKRAGAMIVRRRDRNAIPLYLEVLRHRNDFLRGSRAAAVDIMATALGELRAVEAKQALLLHLADHETPMGALSAIVEALRKIGDKSLIEPLRDFLLTYRCEPQFAKAPAGLKSAAEALLALGGEEERQLLAFVANDAHTVKPLRVLLIRALRQYRGKAGRAGPRPAALKAGGVAPVQAERGAPAPSSTSGAAAQKK